MENVLHNAFIPTVRSFANGFSQAMIAPMTSLIRNVLDTLTTFFSVVVVGIAAYGTYVWFAHGRSIEAIVETKIDSMAADMVEYGHG